MADSVDHDSIQNDATGANTPTTAVSNDVDAHVDELPEDLDLSNFVGNITFPNNSRRRIPAVIYLIVGAGAVALRFAFPDSPLTNSGLAIAGFGLIAFGLYGLVAGTRMTIDEQEALAAASAVMDFPVGHASAQQVWRGWLSRPTWRILLYSNENPPAFRGIALIDGVAGNVVEQFSEPNPETWANDLVDDQNSEPETMQSS